MKSYQWKKFSLNPGKSKIRITWRSSKKVQQKPLWHLNKTEVWHKTIQVIIEESFLMLQLRCFIHPPLQLVNRTILFVARHNQPHTRLTNYKCIIQLIEDSHSRGMFWRERLDLHYINIEPICSVKSGNWHKLLMDEIHLSLIEVVDCWICLTCTETWAGPH